jgi:hypothetical protein
VSGVGKSGAAGVIACAFVAACNPTPTFPPAEQPLVGQVVFEREVIVEGNVSVPLGQGELRFSLSVGAVPPGTRLLFRWLAGVTKTLPPPGADQVWESGLGPPAAAVQILPATVTFTTPGVFEGIFVDPSRQAELLFADEADAAWQFRGVLTSATGFILELPIAGPHLWSFAARPAPVSDAGTD